jgi:hypothetical protein
MFKSMVFATIVSAVVSSPWYIVSQWRMCVREYITRQETENIGGEARLVIL